MTFQARFSLPAAFAGLSLTLAGCPESQDASVPGTIDNGGEVVLTADGNPVYQEVLDMAMKRVPAQQLAQIKASGDYNNLVEKFAIGDVLYHRAIDEGLHTRDDVALRIAIAERDALAQAYIEDYAEKAVSDDDVREAFDARKVQYANPSADLQLAMVPSAEAAQQVVDAARGGQDLKTAVAATGAPMPVQALGWTEKGKLAPAIDGVVFADDAPATGVFDPVNMSGRHLVVEVRERRDSTPFEDVQAELRDELEGEAVESFTQKLEQEITIAWKGGDKPAAAPEPTEEPAKPAEPAKE